MTKHTDEEYNEIRERLNEMISKESIARLQRDELKAKLDEIKYMANSPAWNQAWELVKKENQELKAENEQLKKQIKELEAQLKER